ncbi:hypothetical protein RSSM_00485 [Rhodopirellula sallentina SM41]|uniref:Uncharacterized protein n=1 Tax=Rhodopirellula sallentina SM41 TaxID=1263870 RepID=M5U9F9_9BACT|nr:hypothetical protein RSSM_00485 [Rhodopirellula sallentina SM41]
MHPFAQNPTAEIPPFANDILRNPQNNAANGMQPQREPARNHALPLAVYVAALTTNRL